MLYSSTLLNIGVVRQSPQQNTAPLTTPTPANPEKHTTTKPQPTHTTNSMRKQENTPPGNKQNQPTSQTEENLQEHNIARQKRNVQKNTTENS